MDIFPNLLGENELKFFNESDFMSLTCVLDDTLAKHIKDYINNPLANTEIISSLDEKFTKTIDSLTFHYTLQEMGIIDLIGRLSPETLLNTNADFGDIKTKLTFLEDNIDKLRVTIPARTKAAYEDFCATMRRVLQRQQEAGVQPTYPDIMKRIEANKFAFYVPNDKGHHTGTAIVNARRRQWMMCLRGLQYKEYCDNKGLNYIKRRLF